MKSVLSLIVPKKVTEYLVEGTTIRNALEKFKAHNYSTVPVISKDGKYLTTLSEGDLLRYVTNKEKIDIVDLEKVSIDEIVPYRPYKALHIDATLIEILALSLDQNFVPLVDDRGLFIGILKRKEVIEFLIENKEKE